MSMFKNRITAVVAGSAVVVALGATGAVAGTLVTSAQIQDGTIKSVDVKDGNLQVKDLRSGAADKFRSDSGLTDAQADGPYPGEGAQLTHGANSTSKWAGNSTTLQQSWVKCAEGETAIGGGFSRGDEGNYNDLNIVSASPALIENGEVISITGNGLQAHTINDDWSFVPNGWVVEGFVNGPGERVVRPYVVCATD